VSRVEAEEVVRRVDRELLKNLTLEMVRIPSPTGREAEMGAFMAEKFKELGLRVTVQEVEAGRPNVLGRLRGSGGGPTLQFDGHLDVSFTGQEEFIRGGITSIAGRVEEREGEEWIFGAGAFNMKSAHAAYYCALKALIDAGAELKGDVVLSATSGEIEATQVDEFVGAGYRGYGAGAHYAVTHSGVPDYVVLGEPTGLKLMVGHFGSFWAKITNTGGTVVHTAWSRGVKNKIEELDTLLGELKKWKVQFEEMSEYKGYKGIVNIAAVKGGRPWKGSRTPDEASVYIDVRFPPKWTPLQVQAMLQEFTEKTSRERGLDLLLEAYSVNPPTEVDESSYIVDSIKRSHEKVFGRQPETTYELWYSNAPHFNAMGAQAVNYGPSGGRKLGGLTLADKDREYISVSDLHGCAKVYAGLALDVCTKERYALRPELRP